MPIPWSQTLYSMPATAAAVTAASDTELVPNCGRDLPAELLPYRNEAPHPRLGSDLDDLGLEHHDLHPEARNGRDLRLFRSDHHDRLADHAEVVARP